MNFLVVWKYKNKILILISKKILSKCLREKFISYEQFITKHKHRASVSPTVWIEKGHYIIT